MLKLEVAFNGSDAGNALHVPDTDKCRHSIPLFLPILGAGSDLMSATMVLRLPLGSYVMFLDVSYNCPLTSIDCPFDLDPVYFMKQLV